MMMGQQIPPVFPAVITDPHILRHQFISQEILFTVFPVDLPDVSPHGGTMFFSSAVLSPGGQIDPNSQSIRQ